MQSLKYFLYITIATIFVFFGTGHAIADELRDNNPTIVIHDTIADPGLLLLQIDALNFVGDSGDVAAITLRIEIDTNLVQFIYIQNMTIPGGWLANYNLIEDEITITYNATFGMGYDIDGKLLDLSIEYSGSFPANLHFKAGCEISNVNLQTIQGVEYQDGTIYPVATSGIIDQDSLVVLQDEQFNMPLTAEGAGYDSINKVHFRVGYDTTQLEYEGFTEIVLTGVSIVDESSVLTIDWEDAFSTYDFTSLDTLLYMQFKYIGDTNTYTPLLPGSLVYNNNKLTTSEFLGGIVNVLYLVELINSPDTAGTSTGGGYYFIGDSITISAIPEEGFYFVNWSVGDSIVTTDPIHSFVKQTSNDTIIANYEPYSYNLTLIPQPVEGGNVSGGGVYEYGEAVTASAEPSPGYAFNYWLRGTSIVSYSPVYNLTMPNSDLELTAVFEMLVYSISAEPNNSDYGIAEGGGEFYYGDTAHLIATPAENYAFVVWTVLGQPVSYDSAYSFPVYSSGDYIANFQFITQCPAPVGLYVDNNSETSAMLHWLPSGSENEWDILWGETGFDTISGGNFVEGLTEMEYLLENLDPGTAYDFYAHAVCGPDLHSNWAGPYTFSTWFVGVDNQEQEMLLIYPNPTKRILNVVLEKSSTNSIEYQIVDIVGTVVKKDSVTSSDQFSIRIEDLSQGVYVLQVFNNNTIVTSIFVKE